jgi:hypothetical protein
MRVLGDKREMLPTAVVAGAVVDPFASVAEFAACDFEFDTELTGIAACNAVDPITLELVVICMI